ncbi:MAG: acetyl-CoA carboxylase biotin carboxyl carrier protein [Bacteroidota bacterium]|nr:acetyl-CoA carboxylase biotin carboxyl carrier protein [Bacteroidota bacterium]
MDFNFIKRLVKLFDESNITDLEIEEAGQKIKIAKRQRSSYASHPHYVSHSASANVSAGQSADGTKEEVVKDSKSKFHEIHSPIVGTFYRTPSPEADPYVKIGDIVAPGTVLCVIEAMKLMNEIECDVNGKIVRVMVDNAKPVEYNQTLFQIEEL